MPFRRPTFLNQSDKFDVLLTVPKITVFLFIFIYTQQNTYKLFVKYYINNK